MVASLQGKLPEKAQDKSRYERAAIIGETAALKAGEREAVAILKIPVDQEVLDALRAMAYDTGVPTIHMAYGLLVIGTYSYREATSPGVTNLH